MEKSNNYHGRPSDCAADHIYSNIQLNDNSDMVNGLHNGVFAAHQSSTRRIGPLNYPVRRYSESSVLYSMRVVKDILYATDYICL